MTKHRTPLKPAGGTPVDRVVGRHPLLCRLWALVYRRWLWNDFYGTHDKVLRVIGWRTALVASVSKTGREAGRRCITPCFWWLQ